MSALGRLGALEAVLNTKKEPLFPPILQRSFGTLALLGYCFSCQGDPAEPSLPDAESPPTLTTPSRLRRLSAREYDNALRDLLGVSPTLNRRDLFLAPYDNGPDSLRVDPEQAIVYQRVATSAAALVAEKDLDRVTGGCEPAREGISVCWERMLARFLPRAYRRPLRAEELQRLRGLFEATYNRDGYTAAVQVTLMAVLQSPAFLYRLELGQPQGSVASLTQYERATALAFFTTGSIPDEALFAAAAAGRLGSTDDLRREARRLLSSPAGAAQLRHFLHQWLSTEQLSGVPKDPSLYPDFSETRGAMSLELERFFTEVLSERGSLRQLLTSSTGFIEERLARLYGVSYTGPGVERIQLDPTLRSGVLTRAGFLAAHAAPDQTSPVGRGLFIRGAFLCASTPAPPPGIPRVIPRESARTTRGRLALHDAQPSCQGCHAAIDGIGFGFEQFDPIGQLQRVENGEPVDTSGFLHDAGEADGPFVGVVELEQRLLKSPRLVPCFVRHIWRFAMGTSEAPGEVAALDALAKNFTVDSTISEMFVEIVTTQAFRERGLP